MPPENQDKPTPNDYERHELSHGVVVYRQTTRAGSWQDREENPSYLCPTCFDTGKLATLRRQESARSVTHCCPQCSATFLERKKPLNGLAMSPWS